MVKETQFRNKVTWFTFLFSILVIWVHSYNAELFLGKTETADMINGLEHFLGGTVAQIAVPGFFMLSSYLFFRNFTWKSLPGKWKSRAVSVGLPFIVWNGLYYAGYLVASRIPVMTDVVGRGSVGFSWRMLFQAVVQYTYNPVFWYLFQLILLILLAPVIYTLVKNAFAGLTYLLFLLFVIEQIGTVPILNLDALFYYSAAAFGAIHLRDRIESTGNSRYTAAGGGMLAATVILTVCQFQYENIITTVLLRFLGPVAFWFLVDGNKLMETKKWMTYNFFLYATHFAVVRFVNKAGAMILPRHPLIPLLLYLVMPVIAICINYAAAMVIRRLLPKLWAVLNGGRLPAS